MKRLTMITLIMAISCIFTNCKKPPIEPPVVNKSAIVWEYKTGLPNGLNTNNFLYKDWIIQGMEGTTVYAVHKDSGTLVWKSKLLPIRLPHSAYKVMVSSSIMVLSERNNLVTIDLNNGKMLWKSVLQHAVSPISIIDGWVYKQAEEPTQTTQYRYQLQTGKKETVFFLKKSELDNYEPVFTAPAQWLHPSGDKILLCGNRSYNRSGKPSFDRYDRFAYNQTADTMLWYIKGPKVRGSIATPVVDGNRVYYYYQDDVLCVNTLTGKEMWKFARLVEDNFSAFRSANIIVQDGMLIAKPNSDYMYGLDKMTGKMIWANPKAGTMPTAVRIIDGKIWCTSGGIYGIDAKTGKAFVDDWLLKGAPNFISPVTMDPKTGYIYTSTGGSIYCLNPKCMK